MKIRALLFVLLISFVLIFPVVQAADSWSTYGGNSQRSNYLDGKGNMQYLQIVRYSEKEDFGKGPGPHMLIGNINSDRFPEIIAISEQTNTLYAFDHNLSLLWDFKLNDSNLPEGEHAKWDKVSSLALGDINGDGLDEILFSICTDDSDYSVLRAFNGNGEEIWEKTVPGRVTKQDILFADLNGDGNNEIIVGASNLYILNGNGTTLSTIRLDFDEYTGISEIAMKDNKILASIWHYSDRDLMDNNIKMQTNTSRRPLYSFLTLRMFEIDENLTQKTVWSIEMENSVSPYSLMYLDFYISQSFDECYFVSTEKITEINLNSGTMKDISKWSVVGAVHCAVKDSTLYYTYQASLSCVSKDGVHKWNISYSDENNNKLSSILIFDVNNDTYEEVVVSKGINPISFVFFDANDGKELMDDDVFSEKSDIFTSILIHADTDNDGFDEIITTDPEGRIVIIDTGTPPSENQNNGFYSQELVMGITAAVISSVAIIWIWRKRKK